mgnify:CR=1 FL=1
MISNAHGIPKNRSVEHDPKVGSVHEYSWILVFAWNDQHHDTFSKHATNPKQRKIVYMVIEKERRPQIRSTKLYISLMMTKNERRLQIRVTSKAGGFVSMVPE